MSLPAWSPTQSLAARAAKRKSNYFISLNLWPFVTVMTALLVTLMSVAPYHVDGSRRDRPFARHAPPQPHSLREDSMHLVITRDGKFFFSSSGQAYLTRIEIQELASLLRNASKNSVEKKVYLDADSRCRFIDVEIAVDQLRAAGIANLVIMTENPTAAATPAP
jgi:biopolymer transport protein TolR